VKRILTTFTLERGLITGSCVAAIGFAANLWLVWEWLGHDLGRLDISITMRWALWGLTALVGGVQTIYSSFFLSMLKMTRN
jgi:hypothetical protein